MVLVALWTWVAVEIQMMQPYIALVRGHAPAKKSILLDYTRERYTDSQHLRANIHPFSSKFGVCITAFSNRHYVVAIVTLAAILVLLLQALCASILILKNTLWAPD